MLTTALLCLTAAIYFEARDQPFEGQYAVAEVVMNRVESPRFPDTVCGVVKQDLGKGKHDCQFSFYCDGKPEEFNNQQAYDRAIIIAALTLDEPYNFAAGALFYHADYVLPKWAARLEERTVIGKHIFYAYKD